MTNASRLQNLGCTEPHFDFGDSETYKKNAPSTMKCNTWERLSSK